MMRKIRNRNSEKITVIRSVLQETLYAMDFPEISAIIKTSIVYSKQIPPYPPTARKKNDHEAVNCIHAYPCRKPVHRYHLSVFSDAFRPELLPPVFCGGGGSDFCDRSAPAGRLSLLPQGFLLPGRTKRPKTQSVCPSAERARRTGQCGEEARFALADYEISGKKGAKMRMNINHAAKAGVTVSEYRPLEKRDPEIEQAFDRVTDEWLGQKKSSLLSFTMGTAGLEKPMDKRYFYARDKDNQIVAFIVFVPFLGKDGYMADVTRHGNGAPGGVMETIIYEAFQVFKNEGIHYGSLGVAPLAGLDDEKAELVEKLLRFVYDHLNECYGFKDLYRAKEKYSPTEWIPAYYIYLPKFPTPDMFYAVVKIQNNNVIREAVQSFLHRKGGRDKKQN